MKDEQIIKNEYNILVLYGLIASIFSLNKDIKFLSKKQITKIKKDAVRELQNKYPDQGIKFIKWHIYFILILCYSISMEEQIIQFVDGNDNLVKYYKLNDLWYCEVNNNKFFSENLFDALDMAIQSLE